MSGKQVKLQKSNFWSKLNTRRRHPAITPLISVPNRKKKSTSIQRHRRSWAKQHYGEDLSLRYRLESPTDMLEEDVFGRLPAVMQSSPVKMGPVNKVFASDWSSDNQIIMGTKCNKLMVYDVKQDDICIIPALKSSDHSYTVPENHNCGIHAIQRNPSGTLLATGAENPADIAVYRLPSFEPVTVGQCGHKDWIFALQWLDDEFLMSGSRDSSLALWQFREHPAENVDCPHISWARSSIHPPYPITTPTLVEKVPKFDKVRALTYNNKHRIVTSVSLNSYMCVLDLETFTQVQLKRLSSRFTECVCVANSPDENTIAVGCRSYVGFFDSRGLEQVKIVDLPRRVPGANHSSLEPRTDRYLSSSFRHMLPYGVRSLSWRGPLLTLGTGAGEVLFYDVRNDKFLTCKCGHSEVLRINSGHTVSSEMFDDMFHDYPVPNAVYTHCYDPSGSRLFTAGGPISAAGCGNFATIWS
jgi:WD repeat-containing protein 40A